MTKNKNNNLNYPSDKYKENNGFDFSNPINDSINQEDNQFDLKKFIKALIRRKKLIIVLSSSFFIFSSFTTIYKRIFNPIYQGSFSLLIKDPLSNDNSINPEVSKIFGSGIAKDILDDLPTLYTFLKSPIILNETANKFNISSKELSNMLSLKSGENKGPKAEGILTVKLNTRDKIKGRIMLDEISKLYINESKSRVERDLQNKINFIDNQFPLVMEKLNNYQTKFIKLQISNNFVNPAKDASDIKIEINNYQSAIRTSNQNIKRLKELKSKIIEGDVLIKSFLDNVKFPDGSDIQLSSFKEGIINEYVKLNNELSNIKLKFKPSSSTINNIEKRILEITPLTRNAQIEAIETAINLNKNNIEIKQKEIINITKDLNNKPELIEKFNNLKSQIDFLQASLFDLTAARDNLEFLLAQNENSWFILSPPSISSKVISPIVSESLFAGLILSIIGGILIGIIRDRFNYVYHSKEDAIDEFDLPILGSIPFISIFQGIREKNKTNILKEINTPIDTLNEKNSYQKFFYSEAFRSLYTSLRFLNTEKTINSLVLTSSIPQEGKSLINIILAKTVSDMNKKVLLIDADLRKPSIHKRLGINNIKGLSNLISDKEVNLDDVIQKIKNENSLDVITSGLIPPDPQRLLNSERLRELINKLNSEYDYDLIIFDTPPILGLSDSSIISKYTNGTILITSINLVNRNLPKEAIKKILDDKNTLLGIVTNSMKEELSAQDQYVYQSYYLNDSKIKENKLSKMSKINMPLLKSIIIYQKKLISKFKIIIDWLDN